MKRLFPIIVLIFSISPIVGQNYQCLYDHCQYYFFDGEQYKAVYIDTILTQGDTLIYPNYTVMQDSTEECFTKNAPLWIGIKMVVTPSGENIFYNENNEPIIIKPELAMNSDWVCYEFENNDYIKASILDKSQAQFLELTDTVKTVGFQAYHESGEIMTHAVNEMEIQVSKNYGLIKTLNFKAFPNLTISFWDETCHEYELKGLSDPEVGIQNLTLNEIFDFDIGDEFHTYSHEAAYSMNESDWFKEIRTILESDFTGDLLTMTYSRCLWHHNMYEGWHSVYTYNDTITETINFTPVFQQTFDALPNQVIKFYADTLLAYAWTNMSWNNLISKRQKDFIEGYYSAYPHDCIYKKHDFKSEYFTEYYYEELGGPYWNLDFYGGVSSKELVYYKKGDEEWGEPYECSQLLSMDDHFVSNSFRIKIMPNPMTDQAIINVDNSNGENLYIQVYNSKGELVRDDKVINSQYLIEKKNLPKGIYLLRVFGSRYQQTKKLIIQ